MSLLPGVEFITIDKRSLRAGARALRARAARPALRCAAAHADWRCARACSQRCIPASLRLGFDRARARELQWLFTNRRSRRARDEHVLDSFFGFTEALGHRRTRASNGMLPIPAGGAALGAAADSRTGSATLIVSPCSSHRARNWRVERYAAVIEHAVRRHGLRVLLCGGPSDCERGIAARDRAARAAVPVRNHHRRRHVAAAAGAAGARHRAAARPDSGPAHMATMVGTPVIGLYAGTRSARSGPYLSRAVVRRSLRRGGAALPRPAGQRAAVEREDRRAGRHGPDRDRCGVRAAR